MLAQIKGKSSTSSKMSLLERRKQKLGSTKLTIEITEQRSPIDMLKEGIYDVKSSGLRNPACSLGGSDMENTILAFLRDEEIRPVNVSQYLKDVIRYKHDKSTEDLHNSPITRNIEELRTQIETPMRDAFNVASTKFDFTPETI